MAAHQRLQQTQQGADRADPEVDAGELQHRLERIDHHQGVAAAGQFQAQLLQTGGAAAPGGQTIGRLGGPDRQLLIHARVLGAAEILQVLAHHRPGTLAAIGADPQHPPAA